MVLQYCSRTKKIEDGSDVSDLSEYEVLASEVHDQSDAFLLRLKMTVTMSL